MASLSTGFADRAMERYRKGAKASGPKPKQSDDEEDTSTEETEETDEGTDEKRDRELGKAFVAAYKKGDFEAIAESIRAICR
jgi:hypothetical protein